MTPSITGGVFYFIYFYYLCIVMIEKDFVPYEPSVDMKELGFDEPCFGLFVKDKSLLIKQMPNQQECEQYFGGILAPTFSQAFGWFRKKYSLHADIGEESDWEENNESWSFDIYKYKLGNNDAMISNCETFNTYEEAELACLIKLIEIVKTK
jgi:hypothetical protein